MTEFLSRMLQRAAGWPTAPATPQPRSQFHWPALANIPASRPVLPGTNSDASSRGGRRAIGASRALASAAESLAPKHGSAAMTPRYQPPLSSAGTIETQASTSVPPADESLESRGIITRSHEMTLANRQTPAGLEPITPTWPAERTIFAPFHREDSAAAEPQHFAIDSDDALASRTAQEQPGHPVVLEHAAHAMNETREETWPNSVHKVTPARLTPAAQPAPSRSVRGQSRMQETQPPVEVKIGSVEIVFDQKSVQAAQPAPVRPVGFAEFADLRRYASRPWSSRSR